MSNEKAKYYRSSPLLQRKQSQAGVSPASFLGIKI
tara:strand:+ start:10844 stop:10948 length:105 start_codon:yes stop_codon:yes gene_type:complete